MKNSKYGVRITTEDSELANKLHIIAAKMHVTAVGEWNSGVFNIVVIFNNEEESNAFNDMMWGK